MAESYYEVLGVSQEATTDEITAAYRERVLETHPDHSDDPDAADEFQRVVTAESVLTDDVERRRYDRLGHDRYVTGSSYLKERPDPTADPAAAAEYVQRSQGGSAQQTQSHHARHRRRRQRATGEDFSEWVSDHQQRWTADEGAAADESAGFTYDVHDWTDDIDLSSDPVPLDRSTRVAAGAFCLGYPFFVYASISPSLPLSINAIVAVCTLLLVGWLLTIPRYAVVAFGGWSLAASAAFIAVPVLEPLSIVGFVALACFWIPFGYAVAVRWALRP